MFTIDSMFLAYHNSADKYTVIMMERQEITADFSLAF